MITTEDATKRYNEYKNEFRRTQIAEFFAQHKNEEWFKNRYHPDDAAKRKDEQREAIRRRLDAFMALLNRFGPISSHPAESIDTTNGAKKSSTRQTPSLSLDFTEESSRQRLFEFLDACMIKLEGGSDQDLAVLDSIYPKKKQESSLLADARKESQENHKSDVRSKRTYDTNNDNDDEADEPDEDDDTEANSRDSTSSSKFDRTRRKRNSKSSKASTDEPLPKIKSKDEDDEVSKDGSSEMASDQLEVRCKRVDLLDEANTLDEKSDAKVANKDGDAKPASVKTTSMSLTEEPSKIQQKTQSIFFKHLPVGVTRKDLEEVCTASSSL